MRIETLTILGLGLLGGSTAMAARKHALAGKVVGWSNREVTRLVALEREIIDESQPDPQAAVADADLVILCTPVGSIPKLLELIAPSLKDGAIVTDVGSTKVSIVAAGEKFIGAGRSFVGCHPMAGSDKAGIDAARVDLLSGALCIATPTGQTNQVSLGMVEAFWKALGMRTIRLSPHEHDNMLSDVSHLPHLIAAALMLLPDDRSVGVAGQGFRDATRIAAGEPTLWRDIFMDNSDSVIRSLDRLMAHCKDFRTALQARDSKKLENLLRNASQRRRKL